MSHLSCAVCAVDSMKCETFSCFCVFIFIFGRFFHEPTVYVCTRVCVCVRVCICGLFSYVSFWLSVTINDYSMTITYFFLPYLVGLVVFVGIDIVMFPCWVLSVECFCQIDRCDGHDPILLPASVHPCSHGAQRAQAPTGYFTSSRVGHSLM